MKAIFLILMLTQGFSLSSFAQERQSLSTDTIPSHDHNQLRKLRWYYDSLYRNDPKVVELLNKSNQQQYNQPAYNYFSFDLNFGTISASKFNNQIMAAGFNGFKKPFGGINCVTIGSVNYKTKFEFVFCNFNFPNRAYSKTDSNNLFKFNSSRFLEYNFGFLLKEMSAFSIYPIIGMHLRNTSLSYQTKQQYNLNNSPNNYSVAQNSWGANNIKFGYMIGAQVDVLVKKATNYIDHQRSGIILYLRYSYNNVIGKDRLKLAGKVINDAPKVDPLQWRFGVKIFYSRYKKMAKNIDERKYAESTNWQYYRY
jgi:hypothetical protein